MDEVGEVWVRCSVVWNVWGAEWDTYICSYACCIKVLKLSH